LVIAMIESPDLVHSSQPTYAAILPELYREVPGVCAIDTFPALHALLSRASAVSIRTKTGHYSPEANAAVADAVFKGIADCGIRP
jgi:hypothetical protein